MRRLYSGHKESQLVNKLLGLIYTCGMQVDDCGERPICMLGLYDAQWDPCFWRVARLSSVLQLLNMEVCIGIQSWNSCVCGATETMGEICLACSIQLRVPDQCDTLCSGCCHREAA